MSVCMPNIVLALLNWRIEHIFFFTLKRTKESTTISRDCRLDSIHFERDAMPAFTIQNFGWAKTNTINLFFSSFFVLPLEMKKFLNVTMEPLWKIWYTTSKNNKPSVLWTVKQNVLTLYYAQPSKAKSCRQFWEHSLR